MTRLARPLLLLSLVLLFPREAPAPPPGAATADSIRVSPAVNGAVDVQAALEDLDGRVGVGGAGSAIILDLNDDSSNESTDLAEIAITNGATLCSEPSADKLLCDFDDVLLESEATDFKTGTDNDPDATVAVDRIDSFFLDTDGQADSGNETILYFPRTTGAAGSATWHQLTTTTNHQAATPAGEAVNPISATITNPTDTIFGFGWGFNTDGVFSANPASEPDNIAGYFYNQTGINGLPNNIFEHAFGASWENSYRSTSGTADETWVEWNWDFFSPDLSAVLTSVTGAFTVGDPIEFDDSDAGTTNPTGLVLGWDSGTNTLQWRQDWGELIAGTSYTVSDTTGGETGSGGVTRAATSEINGKLRPMQFVFETLDEEARWLFDTNFTDSLTTLRISNQSGGGVGINHAGSINRSFHISSVDEQSVSQFYLNHSGTDNIFSSGNFEHVLLQTNLSGTNNTYSNIVGILIQSPTNPGSGTTVNNGITAIDIEDMEGWGSNDPVFNIDAQTCDATTCTTGLEGNIVFGGGRWNNGHWVYDNLHIYRKSQTAGLGSGDLSDAVLHIRNGGPSNETQANNGGIVVTSTARDGWGTLWYGDVDDANVTDGDDVCGNMRMTCVQAFEMDGTEVACSSAPTGSTSGFFQVACK